MYSAFGMLCLVVCKKEMTPKIVGSKGQIMQIINIFNLSDCVNCLCF